MVGNTKQLTEHHPDNLGTLRNFDSKHRFKRQQVSEIVLHPGKIIDSIRVGDVLVIVLAFGDFFGTAVMVAEIDVHILNLFAVELGDQAQNSVSSRVMRTEVEHHRLVVDALHLLAAEEILSITRHHFQRCFRSKWLHLCSAADMLLA